MISSISGRVKSINTNSIVVEVGGIGVLLAIPNRTAAKIKVGELVNLNTYLIVREDALTLYGFAEIIDRDFFELLLSVTGIGPKVAQAILSNGDAASIATSIISSNTKSLETISGLGKKGAQRLVLELKDKAARFASTSGGENISTSNQVEDALQTLGYSAKESSIMLNKLQSEQTLDGLSVSQVLKLALKNSGKR